MRAKLPLVLIALVCAVLGAAAPTTASSSGLKVLITGNCEQDDMAPTFNGHPEIAKVTTFDVSTGTPTAAQFAAADIVVDTGASCSGGYADSALYGNRLANYLDHGGALLQVAYDNWNSPGVYPTGRFQSAGYPALALGVNDNIATTLGQRMKPKSPILKGLGTFSTPSNTTNGLTPGATLLAKWADGRNAIAVKGRAVATGAAAGDPSDAQDLVRLTINIGKYFHAVPGTQIVESLTNSLSGYAEFWYDPIGPHTGFQCELKKAGTKATFKPCPAHKKYTHLKPGKYTFEVAAVGLGGPDPSPAKKTFTIGL